MGTWLHPRKTTLPIILCGRMCSGGSALTHGIVQRDVWDPWYSGPGRPCPLPGPRPWLGCEGGADTRRGEGSPPRTAGPGGGGSCLGPMPTVEGGACAQLFNRKVTSVQLKPL